VTTAGGTSTTSVSDQYTYLAPPVAGPVATTVAYDSSGDLIPLALSGGTATSVAVASAPSHGTATAKGTTIRYTPTDGYFGTDSFTYTATNGVGTSAAATVSITVSSPTETVLYRFTGGRDGEYPQAPLVIDNTGALYGTISGNHNGDHDNGNVFRLAPPSKGDTAWQFDVLHSFPFASPLNGEQPWGLFLDDATGTLYGTTEGGGLCTPSGTAECGTAYALTPPASKHSSAWTFDSIHRFGKPTKDADMPISPLVADSDGSLYGMSALGVGPNPTYGTIFRLTPPNKTGGKWSETVLYSFKGGDDGQASNDALFIDSTGVLYGVTGGGSNMMGSNESGTVFTLTPPSDGQTPWIKTIIHDFGGGDDGSQPASPLLPDGTGALYGTTTEGGTGSCDGTGCGTVYMLTPPSGNRTKWKETVIYRFQAGRDGAFPSGPLAFDKAGALYGATEQGGGNPGFGTVFKLVPPATGTDWTETVLRRFKGGHDGAEPEGGVIVDDNGIIYGVTKLGGLPTVNAIGGFGTIYQIVQ
jgi:uncharacterized repeat protein (TIGR03803 family)